MYTATVYRICQGIEVAESMNRGLEPTPLGVDKNQKPQLWMASTRAKPVQTMKAPENARLFFRISCRLRGILINQVHEVSVCPTSC